MVDDHQTDRSSPIGSPRIGLALGAGGARGLTHIGVLKALNRHGIPIDVIAGSSIGAVIGAMYAATLDVEWVEQRFRDLLASEAFSQSGVRRIKPMTSGAEPGFLQWAARYVRHKFILNFADVRQGVLKTDRLVRLIEFLVPVRTFKELRIPFSCCAVDLHTGREVLMRQGNLLQALTASASIPGYLPPVPTDDGLLIDGAVGQPIPGNAAREIGGEFVIAVDVSLQSFSQLEELNIPSILGRISEISSSKLSRAQVDQCDFLIHPDSLNLHWTQFDQLDRLIDSGERATEEQMESLKRKLGQARGVKAWLSKIIGHIQFLK